MARRRFLALGGGLALAGGLSACSSPLASGLTGSQPNTADVIFWNLFTGGDGANMTLMENAFRRTHPGTTVEATILGWGNPYYTKLALATASGTPPDVGISHLSRLPLLAASGLLEPVAETGVTELGVTPDRFTPAAWKKATVNGTAYAVPLDTHPFVLFYNVALAKKAGLLNAAGDGLKPMKGRAAFTGAVKAMKEAGAQYGAAMSITADPSTAWRWFSMIYSGLAGPVVTGSGTTIDIDADAMQETFDFMQSLTGPGLMPSSLNGSGANALFSTGKAGFLFDGEWQIPSYRLVKGLDFNVVPFPALLGPEPVAYADSHALVVPRNPKRSPHGPRTRRSSSRACSTTAPPGRTAAMCRPGSPASAARRFSGSPRNATTYRRRSTPSTTPSPGTPAPVRTSRTPWVRPSSRSSRGGSGRRRRSPPCGRI